jgi:hypothetical protein
MESANWLQIRELHEIRLPMKKSKKSIRSLFWATVSPVWTAAVDSRCSKQQHAVDSSDTEVWLSAQKYTRAEENKSRSDPSAATRYTAEGKACASEAAAYIKEANDAGSSVVTGFDLPFFLTDEEAAVCEK